VIKPHSPEPFPPRWEHPQEVNINTPAELDSCTIDDALSIIAQILQEVWEDVAAKAMVQRGEEELNVMALIGPSYQMEHVLLESQTAADRTCWSSGLKSSGESEDGDMLRKTALAEFSDVAKGRPEFIAPVINQMRFIDR
jgi:hypothetical protein